MYTYLFVTVKAGSDLLVARGFKKIHAIQTDNSFSNYSSSFTSLVISTTAIASAHLDIKSTEHSIFLLETK